ncbi:MAG TPA: cytochrome c biogenesis CcdA family protein [Propionibacteriaceae bacterium]|nr:cytochrome c biogenesis CcdA family protein [Propionibacteriaceae bacterium]
MTEAELALALGAGMLAAVNPCGFALLPAYLSLFVLDDDSPSRWAAVRRALALTAAMTAGFVAVFGVFGLVISPIASAVQRYLPWVTVAVGFALVAGGIWLLAGHSLPTFGFSPRGPKISRRLVSVVAFGAAYAVASLTCSIAPFLALVVASFRASSVLEGVALFIAYALGMGLLVGTAAVAVALAKSSLIIQMRRAGRFVPALAGVLMIIVGAYVGYYGWWEIRVLRGAPAEDPVIEAAAAVQQTVSNGVAALGARGLAVTFLALLGVVGMIGMSRLFLRRRRQSESAARGPHPVGPRKSVD